MKVSAKNLLGFASRPAEILAALMFCLIPFAPGAFAQAGDKLQRPAAKPQSVAKLPAPSCRVTSINSSTGVVTAVVNSTGQTFQFTVTDPAQLKSIVVGQGIFANLKTSQVSFDGKTPAGTIIALGPVDGAKPLGPVDGAKPLGPVDVAKPAGPVDGAKPLGPVDGLKTPTAQIAQIDSATGIVTARETSTGRTFQFRLADSSALKTVAPGQGVYINYKAGQISLDGKTPAGTIIALGPVDGAKPLGPSAGVNRGPVGRKSPECPTATSALFLRLEGIAGESRDACHEGEVELLSESNTANSFTIVKRIDGASVPLWQRMMSGSRIPQAVITLLTTSSPQRRITYTLTDVTVTSVDFTAASDTSEEVVLNCTRLETRSDPAATSVQAAAPPSSPRIFLELSSDASASALKNSTAPLATGPRAQPLPAYSVSGGASVSATGGAASFQSFTVSKPIDSASLQLQRLYASQGTLSDVSITLQRDAGTLTFKLSPVRVASDTQTAGAQQSEQATLSFSRMEIDSRPSTGAPTSSASPVSTPELSKAAPSSALLPTSAAPAAEVVRVDSATGVVIGREKATGRQFMFHIVDPSAAKSLAPGKGVYVNYKAGQVSLDGKTPAGPILMIGPAMKAPGATQTSGSAQNAGGLMPNGQAATATLQSDTLACSTKPVHMGKPVAQNVMIPSGATIYCRFQLPSRGLMPSGGQVALSYSPPGAVQYPPRAAQLTSPSASPQGPKQGPYADFQINTQAIPQTVPLTISASFSNQSASTTVTLVRAAISIFDCDPSYITHTTDCDVPVLGGQIGGGYSSPLFLYLTAPADPDGMSISLTTSYGYSGHVSVTGGSEAGWPSAQAQPVGKETPFSVSVVDPLDGNTHTISGLLEPPVVTDIWFGTYGAPSISGVPLDGEQVQVSLYLYGDSPADGTPLQIQYGGTPNLISGPATVPFPQSNYWGQITFPVTVLPCGVPPCQVTVTAGNSAVTLKTAKLTVNP